MAPQQDREAERQISQAPMMVRVRAAGARRGALGTQRRGAGRKSQRGEMASESGPSQWGRSGVQCKRGKFRLRDEDAPGTSSESLSD